MKVTLQDLGKKNSYGSLAVEKEPQITYPEIYLDDKNFDGIEKLSAGQMLNLVFVGEVKMVEQTERADKDGSVEKHYTARICLKQGAVVPPKVVEVPKTTLQAFTKAVKEVEDE